MSYRYEFQRWQRLLWPSRYDHAAYMLIGIVGRYWLLLTGWRREYKILSADYGYIVIDLAHPLLKLALEGDGERYHMDVVHEYRRDEVLGKLGWRVKHYRYPKLKHEPRKVKREVRRWFWLALLTGIRTK